MHKTEAILERLKQAGERITMPRRAVIEALDELGGHQTTQNIGAYLAAHGQPVQEPTIYRVLQWLKDLAVVSQTDLGQPGIAYELVSTPPHHHLVCLACGCIREVDDAAFDDLRQALRAEFDFEPRIEHMAIFGLCPACRARRGGERAAEK